MNLRLIGPTVLCLLLLMLGGCSNIPYYDESLDWFSRTDNQTEIDAIEEQSAPPGNLGDGATLAPAGGSAAAVAGVERGSARGTAVIVSARGPTASLPTTAELTEHPAGARTATLASADRGHQSALLPRARIRQGMVRTVR